MNIQTDYSKVDTVLIAYPQGFNNEFEELVPFYDLLLTKIPFDINILVVVNSKSARERLKLKFKNRKLEILVFEEWDDIWMRDIIGIGINQSIVKPLYDCTYCNYLRANRNFNKLNSITEILIKDHLKKELVKVPLKLDGGNMILNSKYAFITKKIFQDNGDITEEEVLDILNQRLGITPIIVPSNTGDSLGHIDGYLAFLNDETIAVVEYPKMDVFKNDNLYSSTLVKYCNDLTLRVVKIQERPISQAIACECDMQKSKKYCCYSSIGNYINYLRINNTIILPEYTLPTLKETVYYNNTNEEELSNLGFQVIKINCDILGRHGGSLRCLSYTCSLN
ncbi:MAG: hypothetical protein EOP56_07575 [Sphingobacteriales bacterium]|nr:MAG: hypothetical protein EOP56_07575 [Sphingobacteriales bacterium]